MKNVIIFQDFVNDVTYGKQWQERELFNYFNAQVDQALSLGWEPQDVIICTNLNYNYRDIQIIPLNDQCLFNKYLNKQYGIHELLDRNLIIEDFWFHDFDDWPLAYFEFPSFSGDIGMAKYINNTQWNTGSIFVKHSGLDIWKLLVDFMKENRNHPEMSGVGDENVVNLVYDSYPELKNRFSHLNNQYNVGMTQFDLRYNSAVKPVFIGAFKPGNKKELNVFTEKGLVSNELLNIFEKNNLI